MRRILSIGVAALLVLSISGTALAAKGGSSTSGGGKGGGGTTGGSGSLTLVMVVDNNHNGLPDWNDTVTFNVVTAATAYPYVDLKCTQGGTLVYAASAGFFASYPWPYARDMDLQSAMWTGGAASCTARAYYFSGTKTVTLATISFNAGA